MSRSVTVTRRTKETDIVMTLELLDDSASGGLYGTTNIGFLDHMLAAMCLHGSMNLNLQMSGDLEVDCHHSAEDLGIVLGNAFAQAAGDKNRLCRYGCSFVPMDESLSRVVLDISARPFLVFDAVFKNQFIGMLDTAMIKEFFRAFAFNAGITLHIACLYGENDHHIAESIFKACGRALAQASALREGGSLSTKGAL